MTSAASSNSLRTWRCAALSSVIFLSISLYAIVFIDDSIHYLLLNLLPEPYDLVLFLFPLYDLVL